MPLKEHITSLRYRCRDLIRLASMFTFHIICYVIQSCWHRYCPWLSRPVVQIQSGKLRGLTQRLPNGEPYHFFKGIPYAKPPVGHLRFKPPEPLDVPDDRESILDCSVHRSECLQLTHNVVMGSEDGLFLNVYTPKLPHEFELQEKPLPVMVYIHGGGCQEGSGSAYVYNPLTLLEQEVVFVTVNYRLGPLGFLCLPEAGIYGNMGLKDQRMAFRWIHENIACFGGDPGNVTIFGESAGSTLVQIHYLSEGSRKYFHRVIGHSISGFTHPLFQYHPIEKAKKLARLLGCSGSSPMEYYETLMNAPARKLARLQLLVDCGEAARGVPYKFYFRPVIEVANAPDAILTERPEDIIKRQYDSLTMPIMTGVNSAEGAMIAFEIRDRRAEFDRHPEWLVSMLLDDVDIPRRDEVGKRIKRFYFGDARIDGKSIQQCIDFGGDSFVLIHQVVSTEWLARNQPRVRHYSYLFDYSGRWNIMKKIYGFTKLDGAAHVDDLFYLFDPCFLPKLPNHSEERKVKQLMTKLWTNFAKYGDPTPANLEPASSGINWTPVRSCDRYGDQFDLDCLQINLSAKMVRNPFAERIQFWRTLIRKYKKGYLYEEMPDNPNSF